jgi:hypothetical protein
MRVTNPTRWLRTKRLFTFAWFLTTLGVAGGLEGDTAVPAVAWLMLLPLPFLIHNITKENN